MRSGTSEKREGICNDKQRQSELTEVRKRKDQRTTSCKSMEVKLIAMRKRNVTREVTSSKSK